MPAVFNYQLMLVDMDFDRKEELRQIIGGFFRGIGKTSTDAMFESVRAGTPVTLYQTNDSRDAEEKARMFGRYGAKVKIAGL